MDINLPGSDLPDIKRDAGDVSEGFLVPPVRKKRWPIVIIAMIAALLITAGVAVVLQAQNSEQLKTHRAAGYVILDEAIAHIQAADVAIMTIDTVVDTQISAQTPLQHEVLFDQAERTKATLSGANAQAGAAMNLFGSSSDVALAQHVIDATNARLSMLDYGTQIIGFDLDALNASKPLSKAWTLIVKADDQMRSAAKQSAGGTIKDVQAANKLNKKAQANLKQSLSNLDSAVLAFKDLDVSTLHNYIRLKIEALELAIATDKALLADDLKTAKAKNKEFAAKDAEVVKAAEAIPTAPMELLTLAYEKSTADLRLNYVQARTAAADSDIFIRAYVGVDTTGQVQ